MLSVNRVMDNFLKKINPKIWHIAILVLILLGVSLILLQFYGEYSLLVNGELYTLRTIAFTPKQVLQAAGIGMQPEDRIWPEANKLNFTTKTIVLTQARPVQIAQGDQIITLQTAECLPGNLLVAAGIKAFPEDQLLWNGKKLDLTEPLPAGTPVLLQFYAGS